MRVFGRFAHLVRFGVALLVIVLVMATLSAKLSQNVESRALAEMQSTVGMQASAFKDDMSGQYQPLYLIANMLASGKQFGSQEIQPTLNSIVETFELCGLCLADTSGNTTDYQGNTIGSCADREYFQEIIDGSHTKICEYLPITKKTSEPRVILSIPAYDASGKMVGVLFCSKETSILEKSIFAHSDLFDSATAVLICDETGLLIAANESGYGYFSTHGVEEGNEPNLTQLGASLQNLEEDGKAHRIDIAGRSCFAERVSLDECGWSLYCVVDEANASETYGENLSRTREVIVCIAFVCLASIAYILVSDSINIRRSQREARIIQRYNDNYKNLLSEIRCAVVEYDTETGIATTLQENFDDLGLSAIDGSAGAFNSYKQAHPEFDYSELESEVAIAKNTGKSCSFETILAPAANNQDRLYWLKVKIIPIADENGNMTKIYCALLDVSDLHHVEEMELDTYAQMPGAVYRNSLTGQAHLGYFSDGLCKMLGYSRSEIDGLIGPDCHYSQLLCKDDRSRYRAFCRELALNGGSQSCEYRMLCKDGTLLEVSDTMYAKRASSGARYGYSVVIDMSKYRAECQALERELEETRDKLEQSRIKNASSQMQPHFLYNALSSIREIVLDNPEYASDLIYDFTTYLRACIRSMSSDALIPFTQEIENIKAYTSIEKMRFGERLTVRFECPETDFEIIPLSVQPIVENAIRHGIFNRGAAGGTVIVRTMRSGGCIIVSVEDDGIGFDYEKTMQEVEAGTRDSNGLANLIFRFESLLKAKVHIDSVVGAGTKVTISIPAYSRNVRGGQV